MKKVLVIAFTIFCSLLPSYAQSRISTTNWKTCSTAQYSIKYPSNWERSINGTQVIFMQHRINDYDFMPSVNIIVENRKRTESTYYLAQGTYDKMKNLGITVGSASINSVSVAGLSGHSWSCNIMMNGFNLYEIQYIIKKSDNTTFIISAMVETNKKSTQLKIVDTMLSTLSIN